MSGDGEGGPMKATVGCRRREDIPKEIVVVFGGHEFKLAVAIRDLHGEGGVAGEHKKGGDDKRRRAHQEEVQKAGGRKKWKSHRNEVKDDAGSSSAPEKTRARTMGLPNWEIFKLGETIVRSEKGRSGNPNLGGIFIDDFEDEGGDLGQARMKEGKVGAGLANLGGAEPSLSEKAKGTEGRRSTGGCGAHEGVHAGEQNEDHASMHAERGGGIYKENNSILYNERVEGSRADNGPILHGLKQLRPDSMYYSLKGPDSLKEEEGEFYDPIIFLNPSEYYEEVRQRGHLGGTSIKNKDIVDYNLEGNVVATKRFWIRNVKTNGTVEEYIRYIEDEKRRCRRIMEGGGKVRETSHKSVLQSIPMDSAPLGESGGTRVSQPITPGEGRMSTRRHDPNTQPNNGKLHESMGNDAETLKAILSKSVAGSMREVIKDELQVWLGLKERHETREDQQLEEGECTDNDIEEIEEGGSGDLVKEGEEQCIGTRDEDDDGTDKMISPMQQLFNEEREAKIMKERRTSTRQANKRQSQTYETDTIARAAKRKESMEETGI